jgi:hypothetical protein
MFTLKIKTDNAAFEEDKARAVADILMDVSNAVAEELHSEGLVRDANGNRIGSWKLT